MAADFQELLDDLKAYENTPEGYGFSLRLDLADIIIRHLYEKRLTQKKLAEMVGMKEPVLTRLIHAMSNCTFDSAARVLFALGIKPKLIEVRATPGGTFEADTSDEKPVIFNLSMSNGKEKENFRIDATSATVIGTTRTAGTAGGQHTGEFRRTA